jgi:hypothetical protein
MYYLYVQHTVDAPEKMVTYVVAVEMAFTVLVALACGLLLALAGASSSFIEQSDVVPLVFCKAALKSTGQGKTIRHVCSTAETIENGGP